MKKISAIKKEWLRDRIDELSRTGASKADIARRLEVKPQYLNSLLNTDRGITDQFLDKFIEVFCVNQIDLFAGSIPIRDESHKPPIPPEPSALEHENALLKEMLADERRKNGQLNREIGVLEGRLGLRDEQSEFLAGSTVKSPIPNVSVGSKPESSGNPVIPTSERVTATRQPRK